MTKQATTEVVVFRGVRTAPRRDEFLRFEVCGSDPIHVIVSAARVARERGVEPRYMLIGAGVVQAMADHAMVLHRLQQQQKPPPPMFSSDAQWAVFLGQLFGCEASLVQEGADIHIINGEGGIVRLVDCVTA